MIGWFWELGVGDIASWRIECPRSSPRRSRQPEDPQGNGWCSVWKWFLCQHTMSCLVIGYMMVFWTLPSSKWKGWCIGCYRTFYRTPCSFPFRYSFFTCNTVPFNHGSSRSSSQPETPGPPGGLNSRGCLPIVIQLLQYRDCERLHVLMYPKIGGYHPICDFSHGEKHDKPLSLGFPWIIRQN